MSKLFFDIETIPGADLGKFFPSRDEVKYGNTKDEEKKEEKYKEACQKVIDTAALHAHTGQVVIVGYAMNDEPVRFLEGFEADILAKTWTLISWVHGTSSGKIVGHNILNFDLPFLVRRSLIIGMKVPYFVVGELQKYHSEIFFDTMRFWQFGNRQEYIKLKTLCAAFNIHMKETEVTGKDFYKFWATDKPACREYLRQDVECVRALHGAMCA